MKMICARCSGAFDNQLVCPECGDKLTYPNQGWPDRDALAGFAQSDAYSTLKPSGLPSTRTHLRWLLWLAVGIAAVLALAAWVRLH